MTNIDFEQIFNMPKIELHVHLDGSVKPDTLISLAEAQNKPIPTKDADELLAYMQVEDQCESLNEYLSTFDFVLPYLQTAHALELTAYELVEQCAAHNVNYVEVRFAPHLHTNEGLSVYDCYANVIAGLRRAEQKYNVIARCIGIVLRGHDEHNQFETIEVAQQFIGKGLVAVDLAGAEALYPPALYTAPFTKAYELGLPITIHAGEAGGADNISASILELHASRIGHGVRLAENADIFNEVNQSQIPLEFCPISNIQTKAVADWDVYPLADYLAKGIKLTVNTDNLTVSNTNLTKELATIVQRFNLNVQELVKLQLNAVESIFLEDELKQSFQAQFKQQLLAWESDLRN